MEGPSSASEEVLLRHIENCRRADSRLWCKCAMSTKCRVPGPCVTYLNFELAPVIVLQFPLATFMKDDQLNSHLESEE